MSEQILSPIVVLDPGHAGRITDPGAVSPHNGAYESDIVLTICKLVQQYIGAVGYRVGLTRTEVEDAASDDLDYRTSISNSLGADLFVSIHCNSAGAQEAHGYEVWTTPGQTNGDVAASRIFDQIEAEFPDLTGRTDVSDGDVDKESNFYVIKYANAPACLVELAFLSNQAESGMLVDPSFQDRMARAIARGITDFFNM